jgi:F0F1-type ATP synthase assembly protein I
VFAGMVASFLVYAGAVIWVFAVRSATRAWVGLLIAALPLLAAAWTVWRPA